MKILIALLFFGCLGQSPFALFSFEVKYCQIVDAAKHESNRAILRAVLDLELASKNGTPADQAKFLNGRITAIAHAILKNGFSPEAYGLPEFDENSILAYTSFPLWEGDLDSFGAIPITFFAYVWPSKDTAHKYNSAPQNNRYTTCIHSHAIPCALAVLHGTLHQKSFDRVFSDPMNRTVRQIDEELFQAGKGEVDDLKTLFIHQIYNDSPDSNLSISLHAYGMASAKKVAQCFRAAFPDCSYTE